MNSTDQAVQLLAERMYGDDGAVGANREEMEATFVPMIRVAMRTGRGRRVLVEWVQRNLPAVAPPSEFTPGADPEWVAPRLARLLCSQLLRQVRTEAAPVGPCETVVGF